GYSPSKYALKSYLFIVAFALAIIALANPRIPGASGEVKRNGVDVMIALDVSKSMLAKDITPDRLTRAKQFISKLFDRIPEDRVGLVVFAGRAYLQMPLTTDHGAAKLYLSAATPDVVPTQGTVISDALKICYHAFNPKEKKYKAVVLISDGEDHDANAVKMAAAMAKEGILVNTIGVGSIEGGTILDASTGETKKDAEGNIVVSKLNEAVLQKIANEGNGMYQLLSVADNAAAALDNQFQQMGKHTIVDYSTFNFQYFFYWILALVLVLLIVEIFIADKMKKSKQNAIQIVTFLCFSLFTLSASSQKPVELAIKGNEAYNKGDYKFAVDQYNQSAQQKESDKVNYNLGNAQFRLGDTKAAVDAYDKSINQFSSTTDKAAAWYNKGVAFQQGKQLEACIDAYKQALRLNPSDENARFNLQKAIQEQKKQQQKNPPKDKKERKIPKKTNNRKKNKNQKKIKSKMNCLNLILLI
ncbi:MAG: VWA domain-containing protein, partial [Ferruginibacter sp.]